MIIQGSFKSDNESANQLPSNKFIKPTYYSRKTNTPNITVKDNTRVYPHTIEGVQVIQRRLIDFTQEAKEINLPKFDSKATVNQFKNTFSDLSGKDNSNLKFNKEKSTSNHKDGRYLLPKSEIANNRKFVRKNIKTTFSNDSNSDLFSWGMKLVDKTLISSSSSSQSEKTAISNAISFSESNLQESNKNCYTFEENLKKFNEKNSIPNNTQSLNSQQTLSQDFLEAFSKKTTIKIPADKLNDEGYKLLQLKKIRKRNFKDNKSTMRAELYSEDNLQSLGFYDNKKIKQHHSVKRTYESDTLYTDPQTFKNHSFKIYKDRDIGMDAKWQSYLRESYADEDVPSDDDNISNAINYSYIQLWEGITQIKNRETDKIRNIALRDT